MTEPGESQDEAALRFVMGRINRDVPKPLFTDVEASEYDTLTPHRFMPQELRRLADFGEIAARNLSAGMSAVLRSTFPMEVASLTQEYCDRLDHPGPHFFVPLAMGQETVGFLALPGKTAIYWVSKILGGMDDVQVEDDRLLSSLESDLLLDICDRVVRGIATASQEHNGPPVTFQRSVTQDPIDLSSDEQIVEFCHLSFCRAGTEGDSQFSVYLLSRVVEPIAGYRRPDELSEDEVRDRLLSHVDEVTMQMHVRLDSVEASVRDIASLEPGDVLLLGMEPEDEIDGIVSGKVIVSGIPVRYMGKYGLKVHKVAKSG